MVGKLSEQPQISNPNLLKFGGKPPDRPKQFSLFLLVLLIVAATVVFGVAHNFWLETINSNFADRVRRDIWKFQDPRAAELVPARAWTTGVALGIVCALLVHQLPVRWGIRVVYFLVCLAAVGLVMAWCLPNERLTLRYFTGLELQHIWAHALAALCVTLPLGAAVGWCANFAKRPLFGRRQIGRSL
jgi:hypothetical protein